VRRRTPRRSGTTRDQGSALVIAMAFVLIGALMVTPMLQYAIVVTRTGTSQKEKIERAEAVKGAFRVAMADPSKLYDACSNSGLHNEVVLASPLLELDVVSECTTLKDSLELDDESLRVAMTTTYLASSAPVGSVGSVYPGSSDVTAWVADTSPVSEGDKILLPPLPAHSLTNPSSVGYAMPSWVGNCRVFFPGRYRDPVTITSNQPVYFASGIYYFDRTVTISGSANVVAGGGTVPGCTNDQEAAFEALGAPTNHNITGYGTTWIFGGAGRLVFTDSVAGSGPSLQINSRLVAETDIASLPSRGVSILSVNGIDGGGGTALDFSIPGQIFVPASKNAAGAAVQSIADGYTPSTLRPNALGTPVPAIIDVNLATANPARLWIPGYVGVPQGYINVSVAPGMSAGKSVELLGGVLAGWWTQTPAQPATVTLGIVNRVVQKTFKVVSRTTATNPQVVSTAIVQINDYGEYVVNAWEISIE
jgi:hypothetical protein